MLRKSLLVLATSVSTLVLAISPAQAHGFGDAPLDTVISQAGNANRCSGLSKNELAAMMLSPTWPETGTTQPGSPSPMAMGRSDFDDDLYSFGGSKDVEPRAFWHAGVGMWQLDSAGMGSQMAANQRIAVATAANKVAGEMASRYCNASGTNAQRRAAAWAPWFACSGSTCENLYQEHYCSGSDSVCNINRNTNVGGWGGMKQRTCRFGAGPSSFVCWYVDILNAQGDTGFWKSDPKTGNSSITPLTQEFYVWSDGKEIRDWLKDDTGYSREIRANRQFGSNARSGLDWKEPTAKLCDVDVRHGTCS